MKNDTLPILFGIAILCTAILFGAGKWYFVTCIERDTFNRFSEKKVTFWEAAFTELRVEPTK